MNVADSQRAASALEHLGYESTSHAELADVIVLNTCVVRQSAEDKAYSHLGEMRRLKSKNPKLVINLMGCLVGVKNNALLRKRFPFVDVFSAPSDIAPLITYLTQEETRAVEDSQLNKRYSLMDEELILPLYQRGNLVSAFVPIVLGCSHACTFCIIPYRRGVERSRPVRDILAEARALVNQGVKEITLLGQIVDRYGKDLGDGMSLAGLLYQLQEIDELQRIRFLTSHPSYLSDELLDAVAELPKVMPHIEVPIQAGDDEILTAMRRGYTAEEYRRLIEKIRQKLNRKLPGVSIATDIIVGFPGESEQQFQRTYDLLEDLRLDVAHLARYSPRPGTVSARNMDDDVPEKEKMGRFRQLEDLQKQITSEINAQYLGKTVEILFEEKARGRWMGRTPTNKIVFAESDQELIGKILPVTITWSGPWSMQGRITSEVTMFTMPLR